MRNVSSFLLAVNGRGLLMDCGEGTVGQIVKKHGPSEAKRLMDSVDVVWISHMHADHHLGLLRFLEIKKTKTVVVGPRDLESLVRNASVASGRDLGETSFVNATECIRARRVTHWFEQGSDNNIDVRIRTSYVRHCHDAFAIRVECSLSDDSSSRKEWSLVYTGDAEPCSTLSEISKNTTIIVSESTFGADQVEEARSKRHSTIAEAIALRDDSKSTYVVLTHFSQRFPRLAPYEGTEGSKRVIAAFDLMRVPFDSLEYAVVAQGRLRRAGIAL